MASLSAVVILGVNSPLVVELTSRMADGCATAPLVLIATLCALLLKVQSMKSAGINRKTDFIILLFRNNKERLNKTFTNELKANNEFELLS
jgi:hypothetical protein